MNERRIDEITERLQAGVREGRLPGLHAVLMLQHGQPISEVYFSGVDERIGHERALCHFGPDVRHDLRSVTKSVVGLLAGIAVIERNIDVHTPLRELLPRRREQFTEASAALSLHHVLTMTMGLAWDETPSYQDTRNSEIQMAMAPDRVAYVLGRPAAEPPGVRWHYSGGATELLAELILEHTGTSLADFAAQRLFSPLGIAAEWNGDSKGPYAASGLRLTARELAQIGQLLLQQGVHQGTQLLPRRWLDVALREHVRRDADLGYGYHFTVGTLRGQRFVAGMGNGGQRLYVLPELQASVVLFAGNYNDRTLGAEVPRRVLTDHVLPLLAAER